MLKKQEKENERRITDVKQNSRKRRGFFCSLYILSAIFFLFLNGCTLFEKEDSENFSKVQQTFGGIPYEVSFDPEISENIVHYLKSSSALKRLEKSPPLTPIALQRRAEKDAKNLEQALSAIGYFDAKVSFAMFPKKDRTLITYSCDLGQQYTLSSVQIRYTDHLPETPLILPKEEIIVDMGQVVNLENLEKFSKKIVHYFKKKGYPYARTFDIEGTFNKNLKQLNATIAIFLGPKSTFNITEIKGINGISHDYILNRLKWKTGYIYNDEHVKETRKLLIETGLFNSLSIYPEIKAFDENTSPSYDSVVMHIKGKESPPRSIGCGGKYSTSDGFSGIGFWRHQNFLGGAEDLELKGQMGKRKNELQLRYTVPDVFIKGQALYSEASYTYDITRAYKSKTGKTLFGFLYEWSEKVDFSYGIELSTSKLKRNKIFYHSDLFSVPFGVDYDSTNSILNPYKGMKLKYNLTPYVGKYKKHSQNFYMNEVRCSFYLHPELKILEDHQNVTTLAVWGHVGHTLIDSLDNLPFNQRFYAGGGNSVRGYGYQLLGPLDSTNTPIGGRSLIEYGIEGRIKATENIGVVGFVEAGTVGLKNFPDFAKSNLLWSVGCGLRYYTGIGPIRFDLAFPMKRRHDPASKKRVDAPFQFYLSIGQAF